MAEQSPKKKLASRLISGDMMPILRRVVSENGRDYVPLYAAAIACLVAIAGTTAFSAWIMKDVIDEIFYRQRADLIAVICGMIILAFMVRGIASWGQAAILARIGNNLVARYQRRVFGHLMTLGFDFYASARSGQLAARINENINGVREVLSVTITAIARDLVSLIALIGVMVMQDPMLSLIAVMIGPPLIWAVNKIMRRIRSIAREAVEYNSRLVGAMQETVQGMAIVKAFTMEEALTDKLEILIRRAEERANKIANVAERTTPIAETLAGFAIAGVIAYGGWRAIDGGQPPGAMFSFITALLFAYDPARRLARLQVSLERALVNARMIYELLDMQATQADAAGLATLDVGDGAVTFDQVSFAYEADKRVLDAVSFTVKPGNTLAIVGPSGSGKTTIVSLILRFYEPAQGRILIDGQPISEVTKASLRQSIAYVSQAPYLFEGTVRDNLRYGRPDATDAELVAAAQLAQAHDFIETLPQGYDTPLGENALNLSGGQRQRLSIARAIVRNAPILVLDEATSALDNESEAKVQAALDTVMTGRTTIVIAHRLSTIRKADEIIVLDEGRIAERGTHAQLSRRKAGVFARLNRSHDGILEDQS